MKGILLCFFVFLNFAMVQLFRKNEAQGQSTTRGGVSGKQKAKPAPLLENLIGEGKRKPIELEPEYDCSSESMELQKPFPVTVGSGEGVVSMSVEIIVKENCRVQLKKPEKASTKQTILLSKSVPGKGLPNDQYKAVFLRFVEHSNTFMFLPAIQAIWFFTDSLGGCDIFVATDKNSNTLVIHSNTNNVFEQQGELFSLQMKGEAADKIIQSKAPGYQLKARVYHALTQSDAGKYLQKYVEEHPKLEAKSLQSYDVEKSQSTYLFFGYYDVVWQFYLKPQNGGAATRIL